MWKQLVVVMGAYLILTGLTPALGTAKEVKKELLLAQIHSEGTVMAKPDRAILMFAVETEAPKAEAAAAENAQRAEKFLAVMKKNLAAEESVQTIGYGVRPIYSKPKKGEGSKITGYRAGHYFRVRLHDLQKVGKVIDAGLQNGIARVRGPFWQYSRLEELNRQAALRALTKARQMAEALAQAEKLKIRRLHQVSTTLTGQPSSIIRGDVAFAHKGRAATPIEVGKEEIRARLEAIYELE